MNASAAPAESLNRGLFASAAATFIVLWASGFIAAKYGLPYAEPFTLMACRFFVASVVMTLACFALRAQWPRTARQTVHLLISGFGIQSVYLIGVYYGIWYGVSTGVTALVVGLQPLLTGGIAMLLLGERPTARNWAGLLLGFMGLALVVWDRVASPSESLWGLGFLILGLLGITAGTLYQKRFCGTFDVRPAVALQNMISFATTIILAFAFETRVIDWTADFVFAVLWSAVALSMFASCLFFWLIQRGAAARVTSLIYLSPPTTAVMGWAMFGEVMSWMAIGGMALAMTGVALAVRQK